MSEGDRLGENCSKYVIICLLLSEIASSACKLLTYLA
jgi:hypothetical protein